MDTLIPQACVHEYFLCYEYFIQILNFLWENLYFFWIIARSSCWPQAGEGLKNIEGYPSLLIKTI